MIRNTRASIRSIYTSCVQFKKLPSNAKSHSSHQWLSRQLTDPFVELAKTRNYRYDQHIRKSYKKMNFKTGFIFDRNGRYCCFAVQMSKCLQIDRNKWTGKDSAARSNSHRLWSCARKLDTNCREWNECRWKTEEKTTRICDWTWSTYDSPDWGRLFVLEFESNSTVV